jgi:hypothetical protein
MLAAMNTNRQGGRREMLADDKDGPKVIRITLEMHAS